MLINVPTDETLSDAAPALQTVVEANCIEVMQVHNLKKTMTKKGVEFSSECLSFEDCKQQQAKKEAVHPLGRNKTPPASNFGGGQMTCLSDTSVELTSRDLVAACQLGDRDAQRGLYEKHQEKAFRLAVRMVGQQDAADVAQQVFLQVFRKISQFSYRSQLGTWIYRVTVNECLQHLRRNGRQQVQHLTVEPVDDAPEHTRRVELAELLEVVLKQLAPELRAIFLLREVEELPYREIAEVAAIPEGTVGSRLNRARRLLRQYLLEVEE